MIYNNKYILEKNVREGKVKEHLPEVDQTKVTGNLSERYEIQTTHSEGLISTFSRK